MHNFTTPFDYAQGKLPRTRHREPFDFAHGKLRRTMNIAVAAILLCFIAAVDRAAAQSSMSITNSTNDTLVHVKSNGSVGIGTTTPLQKLDVAGTVKMSGFNLSTTPTTGYVLTADGTGNGTWQAPSGTVGGTGSANFLAKFTGASTVTSSAVFDSAGNIGIGTSSGIGSLLTVGSSSNRGTLGVLGSVPAFTMVDTRSGGGNWTFYSGVDQLGDLNLFDQTNGSPPYALTVKKGTNKIGIGTSSPTNKLSVSGDADFSGSVAIGTTTLADGKVTVRSGTGGPSNLLRLTSDNDNPAFLEAVRGSNSKRMFFLTYDGPTVATYSAVQNMYDYAETRTISLNANGNTFFNGGNVGIGTTTPSEKLEVAGNIKIGAATIRSGTGSPEGAVAGNVGDLYLRTDGGAGTTMYVKESGNATNTGWVGK